MNFSKYPFSSIDIWDALFLPCPSAFLAHQQGVFVPCDWPPAKNSRAHITDAIKSLEATLEKKFNRLEVIYQKLVLRVSSGVPNTEQHMKARRQKQSAFIVSVSVSWKMKYELCYDFSNCWDWYGTVYVQCSYPLFFWITIRSFFNSIYSALFGIKKSYFVRLLAVRF